MAITNQERVGKSLSILREGLLPFVERELQAKYGEGWAHEVKEILEDTRLGGTDKTALDDVAVLLVVMDRSWGQVFRRILGKAERSIVNELIDVRNRWAHQANFSSDDTYRALDSAARLLTAVSAPQAAEVEQVKMELLRVRFDEQMRTEKRKTAGTAIEIGASGSIKPWREVVTPHKDVANGKYQQAEFAADLWQVHLGEGTAEYRDPAEFFRRTFLTESLKRLLIGAVDRMTSGGGDPVVQLQTNFGGGKTHSMLALYHLFSGAATTDLLGADQVMREVGADELPRVNRAVLVGNKISPGNPSVKEDGTEVRTLWGELAWQLGYSTGGAKEAKKAFAMVQEDDRNATSPGDTLRELFNQYGPCLILIDEWVAYARQLHDQSDLPAGGFETQFSFAQALTESAKLAKNCLLVISLPASDTAGSPHTTSDDVEVGGVRGREALDRLRNVVGRLESSWRPASAEEGFEIVRRRLFEPLLDQQQFKDRDLAAREFYDFYRAQQQEFPPECRDSDYEKRMKAAYPIHPEVFDRLYNDWSTLVKFQRTRGVLRLMAAVIHSLWQKGDQSPLIMPASVPIDDPRVQFELTRYLSDNWTPIMETDVDGPNSLPLRIDGEVPNLGKYSACRRVARTIYMGSAPTPTAANRGLEDRRVKLGCVLPGESPAVFGDALRRLAGAATYLYQDGPRYWYSTQPTVTKLAEDRAAQLKDDHDKVYEELDRRLRQDLRETGEFGRVHPLPNSGADVPDDMDARLVVLGPDYPYAKNGDSAGQAAAGEILASRGNTPRLYRNTLVFLAPDQTRLKDLEDATRKYLAWQSIVNEKETLNLDPHQVRQAETQLRSAEGVVAGRVPEAYQWLLVPKQNTPQAEIDWEAIRLSGQGALAARASKRLRNDELLITRYAPTLLRMELDRVPLWRGEHVEIRQLVEDFAKYLYLPRLSGPAVLLDAISDGVALLSWSTDSFAYADSYDGENKRYRGLRTDKQVVFDDPTSPGLLVKPDVARVQMEVETPHEPSPSPDDGARPEAPARGGPDAPTERDGDGEIVGRRYYGSVPLDTIRLARDAGRIADEVIAHLVNLKGAHVSVSLEIEAKLPNGVTDQVVRTVTENGRTLGFTEQGFEDE